MTTPTAKELQERIESLRKEASQFNPHHGGSPGNIIQKQVEIFVAASQLAEISSRRLERQTDKLIGLTWALVVLTVALFLLTVYLCYDAYQKSRTDHQAQQHTAEQHHPNDIHAA